MNPLSQGWRLARTASGGGARLQHFYLPADPDEAHAALMHLTRTGSRRTAGPLHPYDHGRIADIAANEGFSHHPLHGAAPSGGYMASYDAPEGSGVAQVHHISALGPDHIADHRRTIDTHLRQPHSFQGGWHDTATGDVYLDASRHHTDLHAARDFGAHEQQKAIFNLNDFSEHFLNPRQDPLAMKDHEAWKARYAETGTEPHPAFHSYAHRYPFTDDQKEHWRQQGVHVARVKADTVMAGRPVGAFRSDAWVNRQLGHHGYPAEPM